MKKIIFFFLMFSKVAFAQKNNDRIIYFDSLGKETTEDNNNYYRTIKDYYLDLTEYQIKENYKSGTLKKEGISETRDKIIPRNTWVSYYENGNKKDIISYNLGRPNGATQQWYQNGNKRLIGEYIQNNENLIYELKVNEFWNTKNEQTVIDGNGDYNEIETFSNSYGQLKKGLKDGEWEGKHPISKYTFKETYKDGKLLSGKSIDTLNTEYEYKMVYLPPKPKKGLHHFYNYIANKFRFPKGYENITGKIILQFNINTNGKISDIKILKSLNKEIDKEAIRLLNEYPDWRIGELRGIKIKTSYSIPISIQSP